MNKIRRIMVVSSLAMVALLLTAANANASAQQIQFPINGAIINPCNGETFTYTGSFHGVFNVTLDGSGGFHLVSNDNIHVSGTGDQGNSYVGDETDNSTFNGRVGFEQTFTTNFNMISNGAAPNFYIHVLGHLTVNANGTVTANIFNISASCRA
jgi:hypothetical protein